MDEREKFLLSKKHDRIWRILYLSTFVIAAEIAASILPFLTKSICTVYLFALLCLLGFAVGIIGLTAVHHYPFAEKERKFFMFISLYSVGYFAAMMIILKY